MAPEEPQLRAVGRTSAAARVCSYSSPPCAALEAPSPPQLAEASAQTDEARERRVQVTLPEQHI